MSQLLVMTLLGKTELLLLTFLSPVFSASLVTQVNLSECFRSFFVL